jgi:beta-1,4-mannosyl-glycoprotein beta-1,4-N-acetylglucosaminyltransferase
MKIFDCTLFYDEDLILEVRLNMLDKYVDKFIICESKYTHSGQKKKLNFDISKFSKFKNKIIYLTLDNEPDDLIYQKKGNSFFEKNIHRRINSVKRIAHQRNKLMDGLVEANNNDFVLYSDNDEIPNFVNFDFEGNKNKIVMFKQKLFYYKFNLFCDRVDWYGTKGCKKKELLSFEWLRQIKTKKYPFFRFDTFFSKTKYTNVKIIENGGWHFTRLQSPKDIHSKELNAEHHDEYRVAKKDVSKIADLIKRKTIDYDHKAKTTDFKFSKEFKLKTLSIDHMPLFLQQNVNKYSEWFDFEK